MKASLLAEVTKYCFERFPHLQRVSMYAHARDFLEKSDADLGLIRESGIKKVYVGIESGSDAVLSFVKKGVNRREMIEGCRRALLHGFTLSTQIILGLGGKQLTREHAVQTGRIVGNKPGLCSSVEFVGIPKH